MSTFLVAHSMLHSFLAWFGPLPVFLLLLLQGTVDTLRPALDLLIPGVIALLARRYIKNQALADLFGQAGGTAYSALGAELQNPRTLSFQAAKAAAVATAQAVLTATAERQLAHLTPERVADGIEGALGKLLALDPNFSLAAGVVSSEPQAITVTSKFAVNGQEVAGVVRSTVEPGGDALAAITPAGA